GEGQRLDAPVRRHHDDRQRGGAGAHLADQLDPGEAGHPIVRDQQVTAVLVEDLQRLLAVAERGDRDGGVGASDHPREYATNPGLIVHDDDVVGCSAHWTYLIYERRSAAGSCAPEYS